MNPSRKTNPVPHTTGMRRKSTGGTLLGMFIGLVIGLLIALGIAWYIKKSPLPFQEHEPAAPGNGTRATPGGAPAPLPGKPGGNVLQQKQPLEFYDILEGKRQAEPGAGSVRVTPAASAAAGDSEAAPAKPAATLYLQAGAFQKTQDADNLKAKLALMGFEASVQPFTVADKGTLQRVRVGPFASPEEMNRARNVLAQAGVQTTVVKLKE